MRPSQDPSQPHSPTPIYDALYSEYRRSFRALPGDRSGEENLGFTAFGSGVHNSGRYPGHTGSWHAPAHGTGHTPGHTTGRQHTGNHLPAALPPGPRRGL
ncbi:hypothetical protein [Streptomyces sp. NBC_01465]|uniref:hypothetical protein n=1 Tax=Streptomyces sp. NBC_01465 TaxID=2903878 RepID=UPI003FCDE5FE